MNTNYADLEKAIGMDIVKIRKSKKLILAESDIEEIPSSICEFTNLEELVCHNIQLRVLPEILGELINLKSIILYKCPIEHLPESFVELHNLEYFECGSTLLKELPASFENLHKLRTLELGYNQITVLSESIARLPNLKKLGISNNKLKFIPESIFDSNLTDINFSHNLIQTIPDNFLRFYRSHNPPPRFDFRGNPLVPPYDRMMTGKYFFKYLTEKIELQQTLRELSEFSIQDIYLEDYPGLIPGLNRWHEHMQDFLTDFFHTFPLLDFIRKHLQDHDTVPEICAYFPKVIVAEVYPMLQEEFEDDRMPLLKSKYDTLTLPVRQEGSDYDIRL